VFDKQYDGSLCFKGSIVSGLVCGICLGALSFDSCNQSSFKKEFAGVAIKAGVFSCGFLVTDLLSYYRAKKAVADIDKEK